MDLPQETEDYIRESIDHSVGLPVSTETLVHKIRAVEASNVRLRHQYLSLHSKLKEKDEIIERSRAESSMNAVALKKFVEENRKLATECSNLFAECNKLERECSLYDHDREALMDFANEADERAKEAESRNHDLEEEKKKLVEELHFYKFRSEDQLVDVSTEDLHVEQILLDSLLTTMFSKDEIISTGHSFLEAHSGLEVCQKLLNKWNSLRPLTQKVVALAAEVKKLEKDKDHLTINLHRAEYEVNVLLEENNILNEENKRLMRQCYREKHIDQTTLKLSLFKLPSEYSQVNVMFEENNILNEENKRLMRLRYREKHIGGSRGGSASGKGKRKSSPKISSPVEKKIDCSDINALRQPLSPLQSNSPESRMHKK